MLTPGVIIFLLVVTLEIQRLAFLAAKDDCNEIPCFVKVLGISAKAPFCRTVDSGASGSSCVQLVRRDAQRAAGECSGKHSDTHRLPPTTWTHLVFSHSFQKHFMHSCDHNHNKSSSIQFDRVKVAGFSSS